MIVQKLDASAIQGKRIDLGRACECQAMRLEFDISSWKDKYPSCEVQLIVKNPAGVVYRADVDCTGAVIGWTLTEKDTTAPGYGEIELAMYDGNGRKILSAIAKTHMEKSLLLEEPTEAPTPAQPWIDQAKEIAANAEAAAAKAEKAAEIAQGIVAGALPVATDQRLGAVKVGNNLEITPEGVLSVTTADAMEQDNTRPITSAAVFAEVGNINVLLGTI